MQVSPKHILGQKVFVNTPKHSQIGSQGRFKPFAGITVDFADTIAVVIACLLVQGVADCAMSGVQTRVMGRFIRKQQCALGGNISLDDLSACSFVSVFDYPVTILASLTADDPNNGGRLLSYVPRAS